jgi:hypothetical protein
LPNFGREERQLCVLVVFVLYITSVSSVGRVGSQRDKNKQQVI